MAKLTLSDIGDIRDPSAGSTINSNNASITTAIENTLSRDGSSPNMMGASIDMNSHRIYNLPTPVSPTEPLRKQDAASQQDLDNVIALIGVVNGDQSPQLYDTTLEVELADISDSTISVIQTAGYKTKGDGGAALYKKVGSEPSHLAKIQSADGSWWEYIPQGYINPIVFGALPEVDTSPQKAINAAAFSSAITFAQGRTIYIPKGNWYTDSFNKNAISGVSIKGDSLNTTSLIATDGGAEYAIIRFNQSSNISITDLEIRAPYSSSNTERPLVLREVSKANIQRVKLTGVQDLLIIDCAEVTVSECDFVNRYTHGIFIEGSSYVNILYNRIRTGGATAGIEVGSNVYYIRIEGNFMDCRGGIGFGIAVKPGVGEVSSDFTINHNRIIGGSSAAIAIGSEADVSGGGGGGGSVGNFTVENNYIDWIGSESIDFAMHLIARSAGTVTFRGKVSNNVFLNFNADGLIMVGNVGHIEVSNNFFLYHTGRADTKSYVTLLGEVVNGNDVYPNNNIIINNTIFDSAGVVESAISEQNNGSTPKYNSIGANYGNIGNKPFYSVYANTQINDPVNYSAAWPHSVQAGSSVDLFYPTTSSVSKAGLTSYGKFGGGVILKDSTGNGLAGMWSTSNGTELNFGVGGTSSGFSGPEATLSGSALTLSGDLNAGTANLTTINCDSLICDNFTAHPSSSINPTTNGDLVIQATSNTSLTFKYKGSDGTIRSGSIFLS